MRSWIVAAVLGASLAAPAAPGAAFAAPPAPSNQADQHFRSGVQLFKAPSTPQDGTLAIRAGLAQIADATGRSPAELIADSISDWVSSPLSRARKSVWPSRLPFLGSAYWATAMTISGGALAKLILGGPTGRSHDGSTLLPTIAWSC